LQSQCRSHTFASKEKFEIKVKGRTLYDTLLDDKAKTIGMYYHANNREQFASPDSAFKQCVVKNPKEEVAPKFESALMWFFEHNQDTRTTCPASVTAWSSATFQA
jgi:hypothetical protein